jgi:hypothetical protein
MRAGAGHGSRSCQLGHRNRRLGLLPLAIRNPGFGTGFRPTLVRHCLALRGRAWRRGRRRPRGSAGAARTHAGTTGAHAGTARTHTRGRRSTRGDEPLSSSGRRTAGTAWRPAAVTDHVMVVIAIRLVMPGNCGAGEEDNRHDENNAGNDHHPRRSLVEPGRLCHRRRRRGVRRDRLDRGFGWFSHLLIMPGTRDSHQTFRP